MKFLEIIKYLKIKSFQIILLSFIISSVLSCNRKPDKNAILLADREAPLGWISLKIYENNTFEFISKGLFFDDVYDGTVKINHDTLHFRYNKKTLNLGKTAIINKKHIEFLDSPQLIEIKLNKIKTK